MTHPTAKLAPWRYGPFEVMEALSHITFCLWLPLSMKIHNVFHASLLTLYKETSIHGPNYDTPPPDLVDGLEEFEVETILDSQSLAKEEPFST